MIIAHLGADWSESYDPRTALVTLTHNPSGLYVQTCALQDLESKYAVQIATALEVAVREGGSGHHAIQSQYYVGPNETRVYTFTCIPVPAQPAGRANL